jgi:hypothetical protein
MEEEAMKLVNQARSAAFALGAAAAMFAPGCAVPLESDEGSPPAEEGALPGDERTGEAQQAFTNWFWTLDNFPGWSWKLSWSFYFRRWIWNYCYGYNTGAAAWRWCYSSAPYNPGTPSASNPVNPLAPKPTTPPAQPPPGAPTAPAPTSGGPTAPPPGG